MKDINLIPFEYIRRKRRPTFIILTAAIIITLAASLATIHFLQLQQIRKLEAEIRKYDDAVAEYNLLKDKLKEMQENEAMLENRIGVLNIISKNNLKPSELIDAVKKEMPKDVWLRSISYNSGEVTLVAFSDTAAGAVEFYSALAGLDEKVAVKLGPVARDEYGYSFSIILSFDLGSDKDAKKKNE